MTRKRKIENVESEEVSSERNRLSEYGYQSVSGEGSSDLANSHRDKNVSRHTFPHKGRGMQSRGRWNHRNQSFGGDRSYTSADFNRKYGRVGGSDESEIPGNALDAEKTHDREDKEAFPVELVSYLKSIEGTMLSDGPLDSMVLDKCAQECSGEEEKLLSFKDSCVIIENIFGSSQYGANLFLSRLARLKHKRLLDLLFSGNASRVIETLFYALHPLQDAHHVELVEKFSELLCDNWNDAVGCQHSAFLIRCLARLTCGLARKQEKDIHTKLAKIQSVQIENEDVQNALSRIFGRIASLALGNVSTACWENVHSSLVLQDVIEADNIAKMGKSPSLVEKVLRNSNGNDLRRLWCGKNSSRVWEKLVESCNEEMLQLLWTNTVAGHIRELATHPSGNFPLQRLIANVKSLELATEVCHEATPLLQILLSTDRWGVANALLRCAGNHEILQGPILKELRKFFKANTTQNKLNFFLNVITFNKYDGRDFDVNDCHLHGGLILETLLSFHKMKTITACLEALPSEYIVRLAKNRCGSHVVQAALESSSLSVTVKEKLIAAFEDDWESLISDVYGSHVFESIWNCSLFNVKRRQDLMKKLVPIHNDSKFWKFAMLRCDMYLFRKDRKAWVEKMKKSLKQSESQ
ncbi:hypothetical protein KIN20_005257 [Parelaphostrongylus tenuis]|uniref:Nucleolar protein 9 n=1 Tax=Parelaphostrongylus tenuis TaxID=148309 RepID=A0AAD5QHC6_PARTN|nr:hypothetical protein KIN20_005257 [Parelaphostrongylus tenuis]